MQISLVRHHVPQLGREVVVALDGDGADAYQDEFRVGYPFPTILSFLVPGRVGIERLVDVGANIGQVAIAAAALGVDCLAVEPDPKSYVLLCEALRANGLANVRPIHAAASDRTGVLTLVGDSAWAHVVEEAEPDPGGVRVPALPLDTLLPLHGFDSPDLIKVDAEGHEAAVLRGLETTISRSRPLLIVESNTWMLGGTGPARSLLEWLEDLGYALYLFMPDGSAVTRSSDVLQPFVVADYLAVPLGDGRIRSLPELWTLSLEDELALIEHELESLADQPSDLRPRLLHLSHSLSDLERRAGASGRLRHAKERLGALAVDPDVAAFVRETWTPQAAGARRA